MYAKYAARCPTHSKHSINGCYFYHSTALPKQGRVTPSLCAFHSTYKTQNSACSRWLIPIEDEQLPHVPANVYLQTTVAKNHRTQMSRICSVPQAGGRTATQVTVTRTVCAGQGNWDQASNHSNYQVWRRRVHPGCTRSSGTSRETGKVPSCRWQPEAKWPPAEAQPWGARCLPGGSRCLHTLPRALLPQGSRAPLPGLGNMPVLGEKSK